MTIFGEISALRRDVKKLWPFRKGSLSIWQNFELPLVNFGQIFIVVNGQILNNLSNHLVTLVKIILLNARFTIQDRC